jgi:hypothetical protein
MSPMCREVSIESFSVRANTIDCKVMGNHLFKLLGVKIFYFVAEADKIIATANRF